MCFGLSLTRSFDYWFNYQTAKSFIPILMWSGSVFVWVSSFLIKSRLRGFLDTRCLARVTRKLETIKKMTEKKNSIWLNLEVKKSKSTSTTSPNTKKCVKMRCLLTSYWQLNKHATTLYFCENLTQFVWRKSRKSSLCTTVEVRAPKNQVCVC